jgi:hypothetical protein
MISRRSRAGALFRRGSGNKTIVLRKLSPWSWAGLGALLGVVVVTVIAVVDHQRKTHRMNDASVAAWYCDHRGIRCDEERPDAIEDRWVERERAYKTTFGVLLFVGGVAVVARRRSRR